MPKPIQISHELLEEAVATVEAAMYPMDAEARQEAAEVYDKLRALQDEHTPDVEEESPFAGEEGE